MSSKIVSVNAAQKLSANFKNSGEKIILAGGCFDILHIGHLKFLGSAKKLGGKLFIMLESDEKVKKLKGKDRPIFKQEDRAEALAHLQDVDVVISLPNFSSDEEYKNFVTGLNPDIIAITENDPRTEIKKMQANSLGAKLEVIKFVESLSSSELAKLLKSETHY